MNNDKSKTVNSSVPSSLTKEFGKSGTQIYKGIITAEDYNRQLTGKFAIRQWEIMRRSDSTAYQALMACILPLLDAEWSVIPASQDDADKKIAEFVDHNLFKWHISWNDHVREAANMLAFGFSLAEITYTSGEYDGQFRIMLDKLNFRKQISIDAWETKDGKPGVTQQLMDETVSIPRYKLVIYTNEKEGDNDEGISRLRRAYKDFDMKDKLGLVHAVGLEKAAIPTPVLKYPTGADEGEKTRAETSIRQYRSNEEAFMSIPVGWEISEFKLSTEGIKALLPVIQYYDRQMLRVAMAQFLEIGGGASSSGSFAASDNQSSLYLKALKAVAETIRYSAQEQIVKRLCDLNFSKLPNGYPTLTVSKLDDENVAAVAEAVSKLATAGALTMNFDTEQSLRGVLGIPLLPEDYREEYDNNKKAKQQPDEPSGDPNNNTPPKTDPKKLDKKQQAIRASKIARKKLIDVLVG